ncbi:CubicO group peptidase (beta-lactamase class C family) [Deinococcus humi]|uniref:CubicO group peptidase (Beta-lactamase class C family) n=2 Tax=Deinococcus humi TaxID=662880 RepID=A0A7W8NFW2_9DEIO|nr:CubicO group peptidase (beta-lactamase class C family) [Deinococcus humi]GGO38820.1 serine hydrolase [Deinococcus humi]
MLASLVPETLDWTTRLTQVFPAQELHADHHEVTLAHLLAHCAGLPAFGDDVDFKPAPARRGSAVRQRETFARWVLQQPPARPIGEYGYSNAGYGVAAVLAERLTGTPWEELMHTRVFEPLGLDSAGFGWPGRKHDQQPWGHLWRRRHVPHNPQGRYQLHAAIGPAGDAHMNILDFATFARAHLRGLCGQGHFLSPEALTALHTPFRPDIKAGLGWGVTTYRGMRASTHSGSADTFLAFIVVLPDEGHAFVAVTNAAGGQAEEGLSSILRHLVSAFTTAHVG